MGSGKENRTINIEEELAQGIEDYREDLGIETNKEAAEKIVRLGLSEAGYIGPIERETALMRLAKMVTLGFVTLGIGWVGIGGLYEMVTVTKAGLAAWMFAGVTLLAYGYLERREPSVSQRVCEAFDARTDLDVFADGGEKE